MDQLPSRNEIFPPLEPLDVCITVIPKATARRAPEHRPVPPHAAQGMMFRVRNLGRPRGCRIVRTDDFPTFLFDTSSIGSPIGAAEIMVHEVTVR